MCWGVPWVHHWSELGQGYSKVHQKYEGNEWGEKDCTVAHACTLVWWLVHCTSTLTYVQPPAIPFTLVVYLITDWVLWHNLYIRSSIWAEATCYKLTHLIHISKETMAIMTTMISSSNTTEIGIATTSNVESVTRGLDSTDGDKEMLSPARRTKRKWLLLVYIIMYIHINTPLPWQLAWYNLHIRMISWLVQGYIPHPVFPRSPWTKG